MLNADGSLPTDGSGDFELVSKRGPPRGPRGPRRERSPPPGAFMNSGLPLPPAALAAAAAAGQPPVSGPMLGPPFWPMISAGQPTNGLNGPPPLIPVSGLMNPLGLQMSSPIMPKKLAHDVKEDSPVAPIGRQSGAEGPHQMSPPHVGGENAKSRSWCHFCDTQLDSRPLLLQHMMKEHPSQSQELFAIMGVPPELLLQEDFPLGRQPGSKAPWTPGQNLPFKDAPMEMAHMWAMMAAAAAVTPPIPGLTPHSQKMGQSPQPSPSAAARSQNGRAPANQMAPGGEHPLDLTKAELNTGNMGSAEGAMSAGNKRQYPSDEDQGGASNGAGVSSPTPRKRSRKGKAYKLDTLCLKLQERHSSSPVPEDEDSNEDYLSDYAGSEEKMESTEAPPPSYPDIRNEEKEDLASGGDVDYKEIHHKLQELNSKTSDEDYPPGLENGTVGATMDPDLAEPSGNPTCRTRSQVSRRLEPHFDQITTGSNGEAEGSPGGGSRVEQESGMGRPSGKTQRGSQFECIHCDIAFKDCIMYTMHMGYHGYHDPFKCNMCGHSSGDKIEFFLHIARAAHE